MIMLDDGAGESTPQARASSLWSRLRANAEPEHAGESGGGGSSVAFDNTVKTTKVGSLMKDPG
jgi:hypothetical protein